MQRIINKKQTKTTCHVRGGRSEDEACGVTVFVFRVEQPIYAHILTVHCVFTGDLPVDYSTSKYVCTLPLLVASCAYWLMTRCVVSTIIRSIIFIQAKLLDVTTILLSMGNSYYTSALAHYSGAGG